MNNGTPNPIARSLVGHQVAFARQIGWHELKNGELLQKAEDAGYELLLTSDRTRTCAINKIYPGVALPSSCWAISNGQDVRLHLDRIAAAVNAATPGSYLEIEIPHKA